MKKTSEPPIVETTEFDADWYFEQGNSGKTSGEILGMMFPQTLVDGKQSWEVLNQTPEKKNDFDPMLACCKAEMESAQTNLFSLPLQAGGDPAQAEGLLQDRIIQLYWQLCVGFMKSTKGWARAQLMLCSGRKLVFKYESQAIAGEENEGLEVDDAAREVDSPSKV